MSDGRKYRDQREENFLGGTSSGNRKQKQLNDGHVCCFYGALPVGVVGNYEVVTLSNGYTCF